MIARVPTWVRRLVVATLLAAATALAFVHEVRAQGSAAIQADAQISTTALTVGTTRDLEFGNVTPGVPVTINGRSASAGQFVIQGNRNAEVAVTMTLPTELSTGFWTMPISFGNNSGCWRRQPGQAGCNFWNPNNVLVARIRNQNPPNNHLWVWIGGIASPAAGQNPGVYNGTVALSVVYTGN
jgi:hypothetical protein